MSLRALLCLPLLIAVLALAACGSSSSGGSTGSTGSGSGSTTGGASKAQAECRKQADRITDATARSVALQGCDALSGATLSNAKQSCIDGANKLPVASLKEQALKACAKIP